MAIFFLSYCGYFAFTGAGFLEENNTLLLRILDLHIQLNSSTSYPFLHLAISIFHPAASTAHVFVKDLTGLCITKPESQSK